MYDTQKRVAPSTCVSDVTSTMLLHLALLHVAACLDVQVEGELALDLRVPSGHGGKGRWLRVGWEPGNQLTRELVFRMNKEHRNVTTSPRVECVYQYPEKKHVDGLLSNMMNELTKMFVKVNEYMNIVESQQSEIKQKRALDDGVMLAIRDTKTTGLRDTKTTVEHKVEQKVRATVEEKVVEKVEENKLHDKDRTLRTRFKIVHEKQKPFFERIFNDMTHEYRKFYNATFERVERSASDPCAHQLEARRMWRELLRHGQETLRRAAQCCLHEYLQNTPAEELAQTRTRLNRYLKKEMSRVRSGQLGMLCDTYKLCYDDLLD